MALQFGLDTFGDLTEDQNGAMLTHAQSIRNIVEQAVLAEEVGLDFIGIGEHHRADFAVSSPEMVLAAIASRTSRIRLGSAVTVLSSDDPVRVFERFATLDALSNGRAEVILGRGSFTESFPLFGFDLADYNQLFEEKIDLFAELLKEKPVTWTGETRSALSEQSVYPPTESGSITTWVGVGGSPESVVRAAHYGFPLMLAIIGGDPLRSHPMSTSTSGHSGSSSVASCRSRRTRPGTSPRAMSRPARSSGRTSRRTAIASVRSADGRRCRERNTRGRRARERSSSVRPRRWQRRSCAPSRGSGWRDST